MSVEGGVATSARVTAIEAQFQDEWYRPYLVMALQCLANGRVPGMGESILEPLNSHEVSIFYEMGIDSRSAAKDLLKRAHITDGSQTVVYQTGLYWTVGTRILRNMVGYHNSCF